MNVIQRLLKSGIQVVNLSANDSKYLVGNIEFELENDHYKLASLTPVYDNNIDAAIEVSDTYFDNGAILQGCIKTVLLAATQSGKTSVSAVSANIIVDRLTSAGIDARKIDVYYCSNLANNDLREQNKRDFINTNISEQCNFQALHLHNYKKLIEELEGKDHTRIQILYFDESHYSNHEDGLFEQVIDKFETTFDTVYALYISATPYSLLASNYLNKCGKYNVVVYYPGKGYNGVKNLLDQQLIKDTNHVVKAFTTADEKKGLGTKGELYLTDFGKSVINEYIANFDKGIKGNFIARLTGRKANAFEDLLEDYMVSKGLFPFTNYTFKDISATVNGTNDLPEIEVKPSKYRFFIIRGTARAGIRINNKQAISMWVESMTKQNDSVYQAAVGRFTGYGQLPNCIIYANLKAVQTVVQFNDELFGSYASSINLQEWFPTSAHHKPDIKLQRQYKTTFELIDKTVESRLIKEEDQYKQDKEEAKKNKSLSDIQLKSIRFKAETKGSSERHYSDLERFVDSNFVVNSDFVISEASPATFGLRMEYLLLNGATALNKKGSNTRNVNKFTPRYQHIMSELFQKGVKDTNGNLIDPSQHYALRIQELPKRIITSSTTQEVMSDVMSEII